MIQAVIGFATDGGKPGAWDEVYYTGHTTIEDAQFAWQGNNLTDLVRVRDSGLGRRIQCLATDAYAYYARYSEVGVRGSALTVQGNLAGTFASENMASDALVFRATTASRKTRREIRLGGLPDKVVVGNDILSSFLTSYVGVQGGGLGGTFMGKMLEIGLQINSRLAALGGPDSYTIIGASKPVQYGAITLTLDRQRSWGVGDPVDISVRGQPQLRGRWKIQTFANPSGGPYTITLAGSERVSAPADLHGQVTAVAMGGFNVAEWGRFFLSPHKLGKKKFQRRGRQSPKLLRH